MRIAQFAPLVLAAILAGCATNQRDVATCYDSFTGLRTDLIMDNPLEPGGEAREYLWLNASRVFKTFTTYNYYLEVTYAAKAETGFLEIGPGQTLAIVADGREMKFAGSGSSSLRKKKGEVLNENALYSAQADQLRVIAGAQRVTVRVIGKTGLVQRDFGPQNFERFKKFVELAAPAGPLPSK